MSSIFGAGGIKKAALNQKAGKPKRPKREEEILQEACVKWFDHQYPNHTLLLCSNYQNASNKINQARAKATGVRKGRPDLNLEANGTVYRFELKSQTGRSAPSQKEFHKFLKSQFMHVQIIKTLDEFMATVKPVMDEHIRKSPKPYQINWFEYRKK